MPLVEGHAWSCHVDKVVEDRGCLSVVQGRIRRCGYIRIQGVLVTEIGEGPHLRAEDIGWTMQLLSNEDAQVIGFKMSSLGRQVGTIIGVGHGGIVVRVPVLFFVFCSHGFLVLFVGSLCFWCG